MGSAGQIEMGWGMSETGGNSGGKYRKLKKLAVIRKGKRYSAISWKGMWVWGVWRGGLLVSLFLIF